VEVISDYTFLVRKNSLKIKPVSSNTQNSILIPSLEFFVASIVAGLEYIHANGIIHRDIKPENLVFDSRGYIRTTDFGIARVWRPDNAVDTSGTPGYMGIPILNVLKSKLFSNSS